MTCARCSLCCETKLLRGRHHHHSSLGAVDEIGRTLSLVLLVVYCYIIFKVCHQNQPRSYLFSPLGAASGCLVIPRLISRTLAKGQCLYTAPYFGRRRRSEGRAQRHGPGMLLCSASLHPCSPTSSRLSSISMTATDRRAVLLSSLALCGTVLPRAAHGEVESPTEQPAEAPLQRLTSAYDFDVPFRGEPVDIKPFLGKANIFVNVKFDDPETIATMPGLEDLVAKYAAEGLHVLAFPTDQGWFEADDSNTLRIKFKQVYNFGQYPSAVVRRPALLMPPFGPPKRHADARGADAGLRQVRPFGQQGAAAVQLADKSAAQPVGRQPYRLRLRKVPRRRERPAAAALSSLARTLQE